MLVAFLSVTYFTFIVSCIFLFFFWSCQSCFSFFFNFPFPLILMFFMGLVLLLWLILCLYVFLCSPIYLCFSGVVLLLLVVWLFFGGSYSDVSIYFSSTDAFSVILWQSSASDTAVAGLSGVDYVADYDAVYDVSASSYFSSVTDFGFFFSFCDH